MIGESLEDYIAKNKKTRRRAAGHYLKQLRRFDEAEIKEDPCDFLEILGLLLELINDKNPYDIISLEEIGTNAEEIKSFEEESILLEDKSCSSPPIQEPPAW